jgi:hypothetical protein
MTREAIKATGLGTLVTLTVAGLVWSSILAIAEVMLAMRRRMRDHGAAAAQQFAFVFLALFAIIFLVLVFKSGSKPNPKTHLISHGAAA